MNTQRYIEDGIRLVSSKKLKKLGEGSARIVYRLNQKYVLKLAKNSSGIEANKREYFYYRKFGKFGGRLHVARCRPISNPAVLIMEYVTDDYRAVRHFAPGTYCDFHQGGQDWKGRPVFYDYEINPEFGYNPER